MEISSNINPGFKACSLEDLKGIELDHFRFQRGDKFGLTGKFMSKDLRVTPDSVKTVIYAEILLNDGITAVVPFKQITYGIEQHPYWRTLADAAEYLLHRAIECDGMKTFEVLENGNFVAHQKPVFHLL